MTQEQPLASLPLNSQNRKSLTTASEIRPEACFLILNLDAPLPVTQQQQS